MMYLKCMNVVYMCSSTHTHLFQNLTFNLGNKKHQIKNTDKTQQWPKYGLPLAFWLSEVFFFSDKFFQYKSTGI